MSVLVMSLLLIGCLLILLASVGSLKLPDTLTRMAAVSKASTLGSVIFCLAAALHFQRISLTVLLVLAALVLFMGIPVSSHLLSRLRLRTARKYPLQTQRNDFETDGR
ncbi:monovalent cation/H(+) antiporter subunit G [Bdellovibrio sp.]|uniref:cation:proton antiporter n=1 Tax=Bdellovibrio TaxID=958 RepID=UPI0032221202